MSCTDGEFKQQWTAAFFACLISGGLLCLSASASENVAADGLLPGLSGQTEADADAIETARHGLSRCPSDPKAHLMYGDALRGQGRDREAASAYLKAVELDPEYYLAYHKLSLVSASAEQIRKGIDRLTRLQAERPNELLLAVALSELLEKSGEFKAAALGLVDLVYRGAVPAEHQRKVEARIHYLLVQARQARLTGARSLKLSEEELDLLPPPLPDLGEVGQGSDPLIPAGGNPRTLK